MGSVGDCYDNAMCESFFATLECELLDRQRFRSHGEAKRALFEFIEGWYNPSYVRKLVTELSGGVFGYLDSVLERHSFDEFGELI